MRATIDNMSVATFGLVVLAITAAVVVLCRRLGRKRGTQTALRHCPRIDALTGLPNQAGAWEHLDRCLADRDTVAALGGIAVLRIELDGFKSVNDRFGPSAKDELLRQATRRLSAALRDSDFVARMSSDEFLVVLPQESDRENTAVVASKLVTTLGAKYEVFGNAINFITASIGVSRCPSDSWDGETLLKCADLALHQAKSSGRNNFQIFETASPG